MSEFDDLRAALVALPDTQCDVYGRVFFHRGSEHAATDPTLGAFYVSIGCLLMDEAQRRRKLLDELDPDSDVGEFLG